jgi:hypothetical protein
MYMYVYCKLRIPVRFKRNLGIGSLKMATIPKYSAAKKYKDTQIL